jgi:hypothetical protein
MASFSSLRKSGCHVLRLERASQVEVAAVCVVAAVEITLQKIC